MAWPETLDGLTREFKSTYESFRAARRRCRPDYRERRYYFDRGIRFRFSSFLEFLDHVGPRPQGHTLERIENSGHYEKGNVRWATPKEQAANRRAHLPPIQYLTTEEIFAELARRGLVVSNS